MHASQLILAACDPAGWRQHSMVTRRSANALWDQSTAALTNYARTRGKENAFLDIAIQYMTSAKLLYGLALETAFKAEIVANAPGEIEIKTSENQKGEVVHAEIKSLGVPKNKGHDLVTLAEKAGIFGPKFAAALVDESNVNAFKEICRHLTEMVVWQGRYPVPMRSFTPIGFDEAVPSKLFHIYMRDCIDPVLDLLSIHVDEGPPRPSSTSTKSPS